MPRNDNGTTWKLRMLINIMLAAMAQLPALTVSIVSRISDARAYWRIGGSTARPIGRYAGTRRALRQTSNRACPAGCTGTLTVTTVPAIDAEVAPSISPQLRSVPVPVELFWIFRLDRRLGLVPIERQPVPL